MPLTSPQARDYNKQNPRQRPLGNPHKRQANPVKFVSNIERFLTVAAKHKLGVGFVFFGSYAMHELVTAVAPLPPTLIAPSLATIALTPTLTLTSP